MLNLVVDILMFHQDRVPLLFQSCNVGHMFSVSSHPNLEMRLSVKVGPESRKISAAGQNPLFVSCRSDDARDVLHSLFSGCVPFHTARKFCLRRGGNFEILSLCKRILTFVFAQRRYETVQKLEMGPELRL